MEPGSYKRTWPHKRLKNEIWILKRLKSKTKIFKATENGILDSLISETSIYLSLATYHCLLKSFVLNNGIGHHEKLSNNLYQKLSLLFVLIISKLHNNS